MAEAYSPPQPGRWFARLAALAFAATLSACAGIVPRPAPPVTPPPVTRPTEPGALPEDQQRHRVALLVPLSGANANVGQSIANAANLALTDTGGRRIRITTYDTAAGAAAAAQKAIAEGNRLFLGPLLAADVRAVSGVARAAGVPVISFSNDASVAGNGTYLLGFSPAQSIDRVVRYAHSQGMTRFAGLMPSGLYGRNASNMLIKAAEAAGGSVVSMKNYDRSAQSLTAAVAALGKEQGYDAIMIADSGRIAIQAAPLIRKGGNPQARILGTELWNAEPALNNAAVLSGAWFASVPDGMFDQLATKYRARFGKAPFRLASLGYDSVLLAVRIAGNWRVGDSFPITRLSDPDGFAGVDGAFRFGPDGIAQRTLEVHQLGPGGGTVVSPAPRGFGG
ncbi:penicillin-binding protein activator [Sphingomonas oleivorans]|uniref:Penicillin-binding protein activator n=1 Tax=Sphingomonas oleivorans TaxID=1735121 RepID=A0A2T5FTD1_9SPHN|nr:penicillin-binding protein activator [Sphingomonas oleivorans]PTQ07321.1 penicillin-binding protein activator [Sphingomonas oleivorans]